MSKKIINDRRELLKRDEELLADKSTRDIEKVNNNNSIEAEDVEMQGHDDEPSKHL
jgi:hypothetical protein